MLNKVVQHFKIIITAHISHQIFAASKFNDEIVFQGQSHFQPSSMPEIKSRISNRAEFASAGKFESEQEYFDKLITARRSVSRHLEGNQ
jgi:hypothetical protein